MPFTIVTGLLATAGMVESRVIQPENTRSLASGNATRPEFDPSRVTPELLDHLKKVGEPDPERLIRKVLMQNARRTLSEQKNATSVPERRRLEPVDYDRVCLDVSASQAVGSVVSSLPDTGLPGSIERVDYYLNVKNNCPVPVDNVEYGVAQRSTCPPPASPATNVRQYTYDANPPAFGVGKIRA